MADHEALKLHKAQRRKGGLLAFLAACVLLLLVGIAGVYWFVIRVEVQSGEILVLVNKTGKTIPGEIDAIYSDQVVLYPELVKAIAQQTGESEDEVLNGYKGIRYDVKTEGRYFYNPFFYKRIVRKATVVPQNQIGVLIRKFGKPLPFPKTVATQPDERGPVEEILRPARYNINPFAYDVQLFDALVIPEGHVGVVTLLSGSDPKKKNTYTVMPGEKGVQSKTLPPGIEYYNPYLQHIEIVDMRSQKYDMLDEDALLFPSNDSFTISIEGTIEWAIRPEDAARLTVAYGDKDDILNKIILPYARSISRIQGSKLRAREFISGTTRSAFQDLLFTQLRDTCRSEGIEIKSAIIRDIQPPAAIATPISEREQADQEIERYTNQIEEAKSQAKLVEQEEMQEQNKAIGDARREVIGVVREADQNRVIAVTDANRQLEVAKLDFKAAEKEAAAIRSRGQAEANVVRLQYAAKAEPLADAVKAFGDGETYAQLFFLQKIAPSIQAISSNTEGPFAEIFQQFKMMTPATAEGGAK